MDSYRLIKNPRVISCAGAKDTCQMSQFPFFKFVCLGAKAGTPGDGPQGLAGALWTVCPRMGTQGSHLGHLMMQSPDSKTNRGKPYLPQQKSGHFRKLNPKTKRNALVLGDFTPRSAKTALALGQVAVTVKPTGLAIGNTAKAYSKWKAETGISFPQELTDPNSIGKKATQLFPIQPSCRVTPCRTLKAGRIH